MVTVPTKGKQVDPFYSSTEWIKLRSKVKARWRAAGLPCGVCGKAIDWRAKPIADHILSRKARPDLALEIRNVQVTCHRCNSRKAVWVERNDRPQIGLDGLPDDWR